MIDKENLRNTAYLCFQSCIVGLVFAWIRDIICLTTYADAKKLAWLVCSARFLGIRGNPETEWPSGFSIHAHLFFSAPSLAIPLFFWFRNHIISKVRHISHSRTCVPHSIRTNWRSLPRFSFLFFKPARSSWVPVFVATRLKIQESPDSGLGKFFRCIMSVCFSKLFHKTPWYCERRKTILKSVIQKILTFPSNNRWHAILPGLNRVFEHDRFVNRLFGRFSLENIENMFKCARLGMILLIILSTKAESQPFRLWKSVVLSTEFRFWFQRKQIHPQSKWQTSIIITSWRDVSSFMVAWFPTITYSPIWIPRAKKADHWANIEGAIKECPSERGHSKVGAYTNHERISSHFGLT